MFDSHCHLQDTRFSGQLSRIIAEARAYGVNRMLCCGSEECDWKAVTQITLDYPEVIPAFGLHPWYVSRKSSSWLSNLEILLTSYPNAALGEIGLDHALEQRNDREQTDVFLAQLDLAEKLNRPVSIHCRRAWGELLSILKTRGGIPNGGAIHSYSGSPELVRPLEELGLHISFSGSVVNPANKRAAKSVMAVSPQRLLIETDSPDILPFGCQGTINEPKNLSCIIKRIAQLLSLPENVVEERSERNANKLFS